MIQAWWNDIVRWVSSDSGQTIITSAILPFLAIIIAGIVAAIVARGSIRRLITQQDREHKASAVAALIAAGRKAATWNTLTSPEKERVEHLSNEAEVRVRLLPVSGASLAADWAAHQLATMKTNSANYSFQADQDLSDLQDGLIAWQSRPARARKLFAQDLAAWKYETVIPADDLASKQREWTAKQEAAPKQESSKRETPTEATTVLPTA